MATVTKPIALDESLNTTELSSRNVADVLAQELSAVATAIGGISAPSAEDVSYDNSGSGLSATDVQNAIDELSSEKVDKEVGKGLSTNDYTTAEKTKLAGIEAGAEVNPTSGIKTATESFETVDGGLLSKCQINLVPVQSGSGDPYPAGGGKNKLPSANSQTITQSGLTVKCDGSGLYTISAPSALASETSITLDLSEEVTLLSSGYLCVFNSAVSTAADVAIQFLSSGGTNVGAQIGFTTTPNRIVSLSGVSLASATVAKIKITVKAGVSGTYTASPMVADANNYPFAPYSNVRAISGHTSAELLRCGKNLFDYTQAAVSQRINISNGTAENTTSDFKASPYITVEAGESYTLNFVYFSAANYGMAFYDSNKNYLSGQKQRTNVEDTSFTFTVPTGAKYIRFTINATIELNAVQLEKGNQATAYEPYLGHLYTINLGGTYYGGYLDVVSGEFVVDRAYLKPASVLNVFNDGGTGLYYWIVAGNLLSVNGNNVISSHFKPLKAVAVGNCYITNSGTQLIAIPTDQTLSTKALADAWCVANEPEFVYLLATPQTIQLTPQQVEALVGQNNLSTPLSGQSIETNGVEYKELFTFADVKSYVDKKIPDAPTTDGTYTLTATVSSGVATYSWT